MTTAISKLDLQTITAKKLLNAIEKTSKDDIQILMSILSIRSEPKILVQVIKKLVEFRAASAIAKIVSVLPSNKFDDEVVIAVIYAIKAFNAKEYIDIPAMYIEDYLHKVSPYAIDCLCKLAGREITKALIDIIPIRKLNEVFVKLIIDNDTREKVRDIVSSLKITEDCKR